MVKHAQTICWLLPTNCLSGFDHFVGLVLKGFRFNGNTRKILVFHTDEFIHKMFLIQFCHENVILEVLVLPVGDEFGFLLGKDCLRTLTVCL